MTNKFSISYLEVLRSNKTVSSFFNQEQTNNNNNKHISSNGSGKMISYGSINNDNRSHSNNLEGRGQEEQEMEDSVIDSSYSLFHKVIEDMVIPKVIDNIGNKVTKCQ